ncbi:MAG: hypothetical protein NT075_24585 [Chloroflexi bacterium]|nr:hypothetical protein [Chloroflexota bacterium]
MAFSYTNSKGRSYILHSRVTTLRNGSKQTIYFFASEAKDGALDAVPQGYEVSESKNGLPVLKRQQVAVPAAAAPAAAKPAAKSTKAKAAPAAAPEAETKPAAKPATKTKAAKAKG